MLTKDYKTVNNFKYTFVKFLSGPAMLRKWQPIILCHFYFFLLTLSKHIFPASSCSFHVRSSHFVIVNKPKLWPNKEMAWRNELDWDWKHFEWKKYQNKTKNTYRWNTDRTATEQNRTDRKQIWKGWRTDMERVQNRYQTDTEWQRERVWNGNGMHSVKHCLLGFFWSVLYPST